MSGNDRFTYMLLHCDGTNGSTLFPDASQSNHTLTAYGTAQVSTTRSKFGGASLYIDGTANSYLETPDSIDWSLMTGEGTIDFWVYMNALPGSGSVNFITQNTGGGSGQWCVYVYSTGSVGVGIIGGAEIVTSTGSFFIVAGQWYHIAVTKKVTTTSGTYQTNIFVNGASKVSGTGVYWNNSIYPLRIGMANTGGSVINAYMDEIRFTKGFCRWNIDFTPPTEAYDNIVLPNGVDQYTRLLIHGNGVEGGTTFPDSSPSRHTVSRINNVITTTDEVQMGTASMRFYGTNEYLTIPDSDDFWFGASPNFTVELWIRFNALPGTNGCYVITQAQNLNFRWHLYCTNTYFNFGSYNNSGTQIFGINATFSPAVNIWYHIALVRVTSTYTIYVNGTIRGSVTNAAAMPNLSAPLTIGSWPLNTTQPFYGFDGWIDEIRISKGIARWTANFTPNADPYSLNMRIISLSSPLDARMSLKQPAQGSFDIRMSSEQSLGPSYDMHWPSKYVSLSSDLQYRLSSKESLKDSIDSKMAAEQSLSSKYDSHWASKWISLSESWDLRSNAELNLKEPLDFVLNKKLIALISDLSIRAPALVSLDDTMSFRRKSQIKQESQYNARMAAEETLAQLYLSRSSSEQSLYSSTQTRSGRIVLLGESLQARNISTVSLSETMFSRLFATQSLVDSFGTRITTDQSLIDYTDIRQAGFVNLKNKYDLNILAGYHTWAVDVNTSIVTQLGFIPYVKGQQPTLSGIVLPAGTYDIYFSLQGFRWSDWLTARKFRVVVTPVGPEPSIPPVITWNTPAYQFFPNRAFIYWVWNDIMGTYSVYRFCIWKSTITTPDITTTPEYVPADVARVYGYAWTQTIQTYVAVAAQYYDSEDNLVTGTPIYLIVPQNIYIAPPVPRGQFAYDREVNPVDTTVYPSGVILLSKSSDGVDGTTVYDTTKAKTIYVV